MRMFAAASALALAGFLSTSALGASRPASCTLVVKGKTYINGPCEFDADKDGSFRISAKDYFAYVNVTGKTAEASWNADPKATHAHAPLGVLTRKGACWENADAESARATCRRRRRRPRSQPGPTASTFILIIPGRRRVA